MFSRRQRVGRTEFLGALTLGTRISSAHFRAIIPKKTNGYAVVIPKKVARLSVTRHRLKRQILAILRTSPSLPKSLILFPQPSVIRMNQKDIEAELREILSKINK